MLSRTVLHWTMKVIFGLPKAVLMEIVAPHAVQKRAPSGFGAPRYRQREPRGRPDGSGKAVFREILAVRADESIRTS